MQFYHLLLNQQMHDVNLLYELFYYVHIARCYMFRSQQVIIRELSVPSKNYMYDVARDKIVKYIKLLNK